MGARLQAIGDAAREIATTARTGRGADGASLDAAAQLVTMLLDASSAVTREKQSLEHASRHFERAIAALADGRPLDAVASAAKAGSHVAKTSGRLRNAGAGLHDVPALAAIVDGGSGASKVVAARSVDDLLALDDRQFEQEVARMLHDGGYSDVRRVGGSGDLGADVLAHDAKGVRTIVQCKRYAPSKRISSQQMQAFIGAMQIHDAPHGIFATTSTFTKAAQELGRRFEIDLLDGPALLRFGR